MNLLLVILTFKLQICVCRIFKNWLNKCVFLGIYFAYGRVSCVKFYIVRITSL